MAVLHDYTAQVIWTGNRGQGTKTYRGYARSWDLCSPGKPVISCSNDPILGGDLALYNPEDLLISTLSACHMLWYLHLASAAGLCIQAYQDHPIAQGETLANGASRFVAATLRPQTIPSYLQSSNLPPLLPPPFSERCFFAPPVYLSCPFWGDSPSS